MLNISTSQPLSWSTAPAPPPMAPVGSVPSVGAVQSSARESQADSGRHGQGAPRGAAVAAPRTAGDSRPNPVQAAPLLPREHTDDSASSVSSQAEETRLRAEQQKEEDQKARDKAEQKLQLQDVLASVWKASAAVVDVVLGREQETAAVGAASAANGVQELAAANQRPAANDPQEDLPGIEPVPAALRREQEPMAYTEQGASTWPPLETGSLLSRRV